MSGGGATGQASDDKRVSAPWADPAARPLVRFEGVTKRFPGTTAVDCLSLDIFAGEFFALLGPSGCGKTTLLRLLAGFETPDEGRILLDSTDISPVPPYRRPVNMMFQNYALFPHLTVAGNIAFGLRQEGLPKPEIADRVAAMLALLKLDGLGRRKPDQLSGGQQQRVALARSLVKRPRVLLLDEPLAALDKKLRQETQSELVDLQKKLGLTFVIVTHDQEEAMKVADRIGVMDHARLMQVGTPVEVYEKPNSRWVADFIGNVNLIEGRIVQAQADGALVEAAGGMRVRVDGNGVARAGDTVWVAVRPEKISLIAGSTPPQDNIFAGTVREVGYRGDVSIYKVQLDNGLALQVASINAGREGARSIGANDRVTLSFPPAAGVLLTQ